MDRPDDNFRAPAAPLMDWPMITVPEQDDQAGLSHASLSFSGAGSLTLWSDTGTIAAGQTAAEARLSLHPKRPMVIGRQQGGEVPYLDPAYVPTHVVPDSGQPVLNQAADGKDGWVSRGHFMLGAVAEGVVLLNGVPRRGGGVRPPLNGTRLLEPERRRMGDGEEYLIPKGSSASFELPNGTQVLIHAG